MPYVLLLEVAGFASGASEMRGALTGGFAASFEGAATGAAAGFDSVGFASGGGSDTLRISLGGAAVITADARARWAASEAGENPVAGAVSAGTAAMGGEREARRAASMPSTQEGRMDIEARSNSSSSSVP
jgi:hypothetical protein